jgi:hypothetical protein
MTFGVWQGENRSDTRTYREDLQRRQAPKGAGLLIHTYGTPHYVWRVACALRLTRLVRTT